jgi:hypothetical protein
MPGQAWTKSSDEWQELIVRLLALRFGIGGFVEIPDTVNGDCGLEGFTRCGKAFQCYAAEEPLATPELTRKQKAKISSDIPKLNVYKATLTAILGPTLLERWVFVVPRWEDKALLAHAEAKLAELRALQLSFISPSIVPAICTIEDFAIERQQLVRAGHDSLRINTELVGDSDVTDWAGANDSLVNQLYGKVLKIRAGDAGTSRRLRDEFIRHYLDGQNALAKLQTDFPEIYEAVDRIKKDKEHFLATESLTTSALPPEHLRETLRSLESEIDAQLQGLDRFTIKQLVQEAIADWLLRCPLDFPNPAQYESPRS